MTCFCGCGERAVHRHHVTYAQHCVRAAKTRAEAKALLADERNLIDVAFQCHGNHHARSKPYELRMLPDSAFDFAGQVLGSASAGYLRRRYAGEDARLAVLDAIEADDRWAA